MQTVDLGNGATGVLALPESPAPAPAVVLVQEWWGVNGHIRSLLARLADAGFVALAPDLYHGEFATTAEEAGRKMGALDWPRALSEIEAAAAFLRAHPRANGKVGITGFCMGGALSFAAACRVPGLGAVVPFYGVPGQADYARVTAPIQAHFASRDNWAKPEAAAAIRDQIAARGGRMDLHVYDADHAFVNDTRPEVHHPENAKLAWDRMTAFLHQNLA